LFSSNWNYPDRESNIEKPKQILLSKLNSARRRDAHDNSPAVPSVPRSNSQRLRQQPSGLLLVKDVEEKCITDVLSERPDR
jgi:hypothetical protein